MRQIPPFFPAMVIYNLYEDVSEDVGLPRGEEFWTLFSLFSTKIAGQAPRLNISTFRRFDFLTFSSLTPGPISLFPKPWKPQEASREWLPTLCGC